MREEQWSGNHMLSIEHCPDCGRSLAPGEECFCETPYCPECNSREDWQEDGTCSCGYDPEVEE